MCSERPIEYDDCEENNYTSDCGPEPVIEGATRVNAKFRHEGRGNEPAGENRIKASFDPRIDIESSFDDQIRNKFAE